MPLRPFTLVGLLLFGCGTKGSDFNDPVGGGASAGAGATMSGAGAGGAAASSGTAGRAASGASGGLGAGGTTGTSGATSGGSGGAVAAAGSSATGGASGQGAGGGGIGTGASGGVSSGAGGASAGAAPGGAGGRAQGGNGGVTSGGAGASGGVGPGNGGGGSAAAGASGAGATGNVTVWLSGDSTMANGNTPCPVGWGKVFKPYFNDKVTVTNSAVGGRSIRSWLYNVGTTMDSSGECVLAVDSSGEPTVQARWTQMLNGMKAGDYLIVQFGINDGDSTCDRHVGIEAFKETLGVMAQAAKDHGTQPIFATPVSAIACNGSTARGTRGAYVDATIAAGTTFNVPVIDLHALSVALYNSLGFCPLSGGDVSASTTGPVGDFFCDDHTHFETAGAEQIAGLIAQALRDQGIGLAGYLK